MIRSGATFADGAAEYLRYCEQDRGRKPSTLRDHRSDLDAHLLPALGEQPLEAITPDAIDAWRSSLTSLSSRTKEQASRRDGRGMRRAEHIWDLPANPVASGEKYRRRAGGDIDVFSPEVVMAPVRAADPSGTRQSS
jgi:hypothetical protein